MHRALEDKNKDEKCDGLMHCYDSAGAQMDNPSAQSKFEHNRLVYCIYFPLDIGTCYDDFNSYIISNTDLEPQKQEMD